VGIFLVDTVYVNYQNPEDVSFKHEKGTTPIKCDDLTFIGVSSGRALFKCPQNKVYYVYLSQGGLDYLDFRRPPKIYREHYVAKSSFMLGNDDAFFRGVGRLNQFGKTKTVKPECITNFTMFLFAHIGGKSVGTVCDGKLYGIHKYQFRVDQHGQHEPRIKIEQFNHQGKTIKIIQLPNENLTLPVDIMADVFNIHHRTNIHVENSP